MAFRRCLAALSVTASIWPGAALALGPGLDAGARGGAGAILNTGGDGPNIFALGILFFAGLFLLGHVFGLISGLLTMNREKIVKGLSGVAATVVGVGVFFALWLGLIAVVAALTGWTGGASFTGFVLAVVLYFPLVIYAIRFGRAASSALGFRIGDVP
jgi:hypothetical protein